MMRSLSSFAGFLAVIGLAAAAWADSPPLQLRGTHYAVYPVREGETVQFVMRPKIQSDRGGVLPSYEVLDHESRICVPRKSFLEMTNVEYRAAGTGVNAVVLHSNRHWSTLDFGNRPIVLCARPNQPLHFSGVVGPIYFWIPKSARTVGLTVCCPDKKEGGTIRVVDSMGKRVFDESDWFHEPRRIRFPTSEEARGTTWYFETANPKTLGKPYGIDDVIVHIDSGALPFVSTSVEALQEVLRQAGELP